MSLSLVFLLVASIAATPLHKSHEPHSVSNHLHRKRHAQSPRRSLDGAGIIGARRVPPIYGSRHFSPFVADVSSNPNESGVTLAPSVVEGRMGGNIGMYVSSPKKDANRDGRKRLVSLHHLIHRARGEALKASSESSIAKLKASTLLAINQGLKAKMKANEAEMLEEEEQRLVAQRSANPQILVKDTVPIANVANNSLSFEHHNELLRRKLDMIGKDQDDAVRRVEQLARLHRARTAVLPDSLAKSDPNLLKDFVDSGPARGLTFEVPVDPSIGDFYVSSAPGEELHVDDVKPTIGDLPYFVAHGYDQTPRNGLDPMSNTGVPR